MMIDCFGSDSKLMKFVYDSHTHELFTCDCSHDKTQDDSVDGCEFCSLHLFTSLALFALNLLDRRFSSSGLILNSHLRRSEMLNKGTKEHVLRITTANKHMRTPVTSVSGSATDRA